jgi:hypothetical protein
LTAFFYLIQFFNLITLSHNSIIKKSINLLIGSKTLLYPAVLGLIK